MADTSQSKKKCTIVGGAGFVGQRLHRILDDSSLWNPSVADIQSAEPACDVTSLESVSRAVQDAGWVINLAAVHHDNIRPISRYYDVNVQGARNICEACRQHGIQRQVFVSSVAVYGDTLGQAASEATPHRPFNDYGMSKSQAEEVYRNWWNEDHQRHLVILRPTVIFGEQNRGNLYNLMNSIASGSFRMVGDGNVVKSIAYVDNVARFIPFAMETSSAGIEIFNYADKPDLTTAEIVRIVREELGIADRRLPHVPYWLAYLGGLAFDVLGRLTPIKSQISAQRVKKFCTATPISTERMQISGYVPTVPVIEGLRRTVRSEFSHMA